MSKTALERFEEKYIPEPNSGCWLWTGAEINGGYGSFVFGPPMKGYRAKPAHRASWEIFRGPIPDGLEVCHSCDVTCCVNPDHLWLGTHAQNMADCISKNRFVHPERTRGAQQKNAKLTEAQVREIKTRQKSARAYAAIFGVRPDHINHIQSGRAWPHIQIDPSLVKPQRIQTEEQAKKAAYLREWKKRRALAASA